MSAAPLVVAGVPVYNGMRFLRDTLETIAAQDYPNLRIVISDDASTDGSLDLCRELESRDARVTVIAQPERLGWIGNCNALLRYAEGEYFLWMAHDDLYEPSFVRLLVERLEASPGAVLAFSGGTMLNPDGSVYRAIPTSDCIEPGLGRFRRALRFVWWTEDEKGRPYRGVMRTEELRKTAGLRRVRFAADSLLMFEMAMQGGLALEPRPLYCKYVYPESVSWQYGNTADEWIEYLGAYLEIVDEAGFPLLQRLALRASVRLRQARFRLRRLIRRPESMS